MDYTKLKSVCIEDEWGDDESGEFCERFADYFPELLTTYFGGDWQIVPPMFSSEQPSDSDVQHWARYHLEMM